MKSYCENTIEIALKRLNEKKLVIYLFDEALQNRLKSNCQNQRLRDELTMDNLPCEFCNRRPKHFCSSIDRPWATMYNIKPGKREYLKSASMT